MAGKPPEPLYLDPRKIALWTLAGLTLLILAGLMLWPKYHRYLETERAKTRVEVERILKGKQ